MSVVPNFFRGMLSVITVTAAPQLYRYPYRTAAEGLRGDMLRVGEDVESVIGKLGEWRPDATHPDHPRRPRKAPRHG